MKVRTSHDTIEDFDRNKIVRALVAEASAPPRIAEKIAAEVESYLSRIEVFPTTTMIREMVNAKLVEYGFDDIAARHQRLGLPIYDVNKILTKGHRMDSSTQFNPESIHKYMGDIIARDYALSSVIPPQIADAHRRGMIHIHDLEYFVTRPYSFVHDLRDVFLNGLRVDGSGRDTAVAGPAKQPEVAVFHAAKALAASQVFWSGGQSYNFFNIFMAPYFRGRTEKEITQLCQMFIYEMGQQYVARGGQMVLSSVSLYPGIPQALSEARAVKPGGVLGPETYADFWEESVQIFRGILRVLLQGDYSGKPFRFPQIEVKIDPSQVARCEEDYLAACELASRFGSPAFLNMYRQDILPWHCSVEGSLIVEGAHGCDSSMRGGVLQEITINLPRIACESRGREGRFRELLHDRMELARQAIVLKKELIGSRMEEGSLGFAAQLVGGIRRLELDQQRAYLGIVGLNEASKHATGSELHESADARDFARSTLRMMVEDAGDLSRDSALELVICQSPSPEAANRLARIDRKDFGKRFVGQGDPSDGSVIYTDGAQTRASAEIPVEERLEIEADLHPFLKGGAVFNVHLGDSPSAGVIWKEALRIARTQVGLFVFTQDLTLCMSCQAVLRGLLSECTRCGSEEVDWISRAGGAVSRVGIRDEIGGWNPGARNQLLSRKRYLL